MARQEIDPAQLTEVENALALQFARTVEAEGPASDRDIAGAILLSMCLGVRHELPKEEPTQASQEAYEVFRRVGVDEELASKHADAITDHRLARFCNTGPAAKYMRPVGRYGYWPQRLINSAQEFLAEED